MADYSAVEPPQALGIEMSVIASLVADTRQIKTTAERLQAEAFFKQAHRVIYAAMVDMSWQGETIDIVAISHYLTRKNTIDKIGGDVYLAELLSYQTAASLDGHIKTINEYYARRQAIVSAQRMIADSFDTAKPIDELIGDAEKMYERINSDCEKAGATRYRRGTVVHPIDCREQVKNFKTTASTRAVSTGWENVDPFFRLAKGTVTALHGIPHMGKTELLDQLMVQISEAHNWKWAVYSPESLSETWTHEAHLQRLIVKHLRKPLHEITEIEIDVSLEWLNRHIVFLHPDDDNVTLSVLKKLYAEENARGKIDGFVVDPWNSMQPEYLPKEDSNDYYNRVLRGIQGWTKRNNLATIFAIHPTKVLKDKKTGIYEVPGPYDMFGSSQFFNKLDNILCIYRDYKALLTHLYIQKVKWKHHGYYGMTTFKWDNWTDRFVDAGAKAGEPDKDDNDLLKGFI